MMLGSDVDIGDLIKLVSNGNTGIVIGYKTTMTDMIIGDRMTYDIMINGEKIYAIRESFEIIAKLWERPNLQNPLGGARGKLRIKTKDL